MATVETPSDLKLLPLRALVAYAARCARRVQPLYAIPEDHPDAQSSAAAIDRAIRLAEDFAAGRTVDPEPLKESEEAIVRALMVANEDDVCDEPAAYAANAAYAVVDATRTALATADAEDPVAAARKVVDSATIATDAAKAADPSVQRAARLDWEMLHRMHLGRFPEFGEPIDPGEAGMLGPLFCGQPRIERKAAPAPKMVPRSRRKRGEAEGPSARRGTSKAPRSKKSAVGSKKVEQWIEKLQARQEQLKSERAAFRVERALFQSELNSFHLQRDELLAEQADFETARGEFARKRDELAELQAGIERQRCELDEREVQLREATAETAEQPEELREHLTQLRAALQSSEEERTRLREEVEQHRQESTSGGDRDDLRSQIARLRSQTERLEAERETLRAEVEQHRQRADDLERTREAFDAERRELDEAHHRLHEEQEALETLSEEAAALRQQAADAQAHADDQQRRIEALRIDLERERAELDVARQSEGDAQNAELQKQLTEVREERDRFDAERSKLTKELRRLQSLDGGPDRSSATASEIPVLEAPRSKTAAAPPEAEMSAPPLRLLIQRGTAAAGEVAALFDEISRLDQRLGGTGVCFTISDCRVRRRAANSHRKGTGTEERSFVELLLRPAVAEKGARAAFNAGQWDQLRSCLCMIMRLDAGLAGGFDSGAAAPGNHPAHQLVADAISRAYAALAAHRHAVEADPSALRIDSVNQQLHRVEQLLRTLERQRMLGIELTPIVETESVVTELSATKTPSAAARRWRFRRLLLLLAGTLAFAAGVHFWDELCRYLGVAPAAKAATVEEGRPPMLRGLDGGDSA